MINPEEEERIKALRRLSKSLQRLVGLLSILLAFLFYAAFMDPSLSKINRLIAGLGQEEQVESPESIAALPEIEKGIHLPTGLVAEGDYLLVAQHCTPCHSAKLVTQNRMSKEGWTSTIHWMQETQNLWDLGENEALIVAYLANYYAPEESGRRKPLKVEEWYAID